MYAHFDGFQFAIGGASVAAGAASFIKVYGLA